MKHSGENIGSKTDVGTGCRRKLHNKQLHNLYFSLNNIPVIKSRRICWVGQVARMGAWENRIQF
jgi:hypothetical protein